jgi:hypothetical protein
MYFRIVLLSGVILTGLLNAPSVMRANDAVRLLDSFEELQNSVGGYRNGFACSPSTSVCRRVPHENAQGHCYRIRARRSESGFCGAWIHLHDFRATEPEFVDASDWEYLTFRIRTKSSVSGINVRLADEKWIRKGDAVTIGPISRWAENATSSTWKHVAIPLSVAKDINLERLGAVSLEFSGSGNFTVFVDDLCLKRSPEVDAPASIIRAASNTNGWPGRAMWVWTTDAIVRNSQESGRLLAACRSERIDSLWMQLPYGITTRTHTTQRPNFSSSDIALEPTDDLSVQIKSAAHLRAFIRKAHDQGIQIHALDGSPEFAVRSGHAIPLAVVDAVADFNSTSKTEECFDGIHFDNEPYLLLGWINAGQREDILRDFLTLNLECQHKAREAGLTFGVDVPFWWNARDPETAEDAGAVTFRGTRKAATFHCIDHLHTAVR